MQRETKMIESKEIATVKAERQMDNGMVGRYVIVRCRDAGVHAGTLKAHSGRECILTGARRLWYWKPASGKWLSAAANNGLHESSEISESVEIIHLTENCEIILCQEKAKASITQFKSSSTDDDN